MLITLSDVSFFLTTKQPSFYLFIVQKLFCLKKLPAHYERF